MPLPVPVITKIEIGQAYGAFAEELADRIRAEIKASDVRAEFKVAAAHHVGVLLKGVDALDLPVVEIGFSAVPRPPDHGSDFQWGNDPLSKSSDALVNQLDSEIAPRQGPAKDHLAIFKLDLREHFGILQRLSRLRETFSHDIVDSVEDKAEFMRHFRKYLRDDADPAKDQICHYGRTETPLDPRKERNRVEMSVGGIPVRWGLVFEQLPVEKRPSVILANVVAAARLRVSP